MKHFIVLSLLVITASVTNSQAVFAPVKGAEWRYDYQTEYYGTWGPILLPIIPRPRKGILTIRYTKDTVVNTIAVKKFESSYRYIFQGSDTIYNSAMPSIFMTQRNDSVFLLNKDTLVLAFVYKSNIGAITSIPSKSSGHKLLLETRRVVDTNFVSTKLKKFEYALTLNPSGLVDVGVPNRLIIFDRVGVSNTDMTFISSQPEYYPFPPRYNLRCYQDIEIGEILFSPRNCESITAIKNISDERRDDFTITFDELFFYVKAKNNDSLHDSKMILYDLHGRILNQINLDRYLEQVVISRNNLPKGILLITKISGGSIIHSQKIFNF